MVWQQRSGRWALQQTLGSDSLGGLGTGEFEAPGDSTDLVTRTYRVPRYFAECATCPHAYGMHRFRWRASGFERIEDRVVPSTYSTFVAFIQSLLAGDRDAGTALVTQPSLVDAAIHAEWNQAKGTWRIAPVTDETPRRLVFFRGEKDAYRVEFEQRGRRG